MVALCAFRVQTEERQAAILASTLAAESAWGYTLFAAGFEGAFLTGLYTFRMLFLVFWGEPTPYVREHHHAHHGKEGPFSMTSTVAVLAEARR